MFATQEVKTHAVQFENEQDARRFVRVIRRKGWEARRKGREVYVVIGDEISLNLLVQQWAIRSKRSPHYDDYTIFAL